MKCQVTSICICTVPCASSLCVCYGSDLTSSIMSLGRMYTMSLMWNNMVIKISKIITSLDLDTM